MVGPRVPTVSKARPPSKFYLHPPLEGGDFKLENEIPNIKALAPKGKKDEEMWKKIMRCSKDVTLVVQHRKKL